MLARHLDEEAEHVVVFYFERLDLGFVGVALLQARDHAARLVAQISRSIEVLIVALPHEAAVALRERQFVGKRFGDRIAKSAIRRTHRLRGKRNLVRYAVRTFQNRGKREGRAQGLADRRKIARSSAIKRNAGKRARKIGRGRQRLPDFRAQCPVFEKVFDAVEAARDLLCSAKWAREAAREHARACRRHGAVNRGQETAARIAAHRAQ